MGSFGFSERLKPISDLIKAFITSRLRHTRIHIGVLMSLARDSGFKIVGSTADGQTRCRISCFLKILEVAMRVARFPYPTTEQLNC